MVTGEERVEGEGSTSRQSKCIEAGAEKAVRDAWEGRAHVSDEADGQRGVRLGVAHVAEGTVDDEHVVEEASPRDSALIRVAPKLKFWTNFADQNLRHQLHIGIIHGDRSGVLRPGIDGAPFFAGRMFWYHSHQSIIGARGKCFSREEASRQKSQCGSSLMSRTLPHFERKTVRAR